MSRFYINEPLESGALLTLADPHYNYIARVLRMREGESITLFNGQGGEYSATIESIAKRDLTILVGDFNPENRTSPLTIHLYQAMAKGEKMELVFQKATELGVTSITPIITERSVATLKAAQLPKKMERWNAIIESSCEQCGLNIVPTLNEPIPFKALLDRLSTGGSAKRADADHAYLTLAPTGEKSFGELINTELSGKREFSIIIGPEGGLSADEIDALTEKGAHSTRMGNRILRTETAALSVISSLHALIGDWAE